MAVSDDAGRKRDDLGRPPPMAYACPVMNRCFSRPAASTFTARLGDCLSFLGWSLLAFGLIGLSACAPAPPGGDATSDFRLASLDGSMLGPADFPGKVIVVDFWASWCAPCRKQASILDEVHEELEARGVQFLSVNLGEDEETVREYVAETPFPYPTLMDPEETLGEAFEIYFLPTLLVLNADRGIVYLDSGVVDGPRLRKLITEAGA